MRRPQTPLRAGAFVRRVIDALELQDNPRQRARKDEYRGAGALAALLGVERVTVTRWLDDKRTPEYVPTMQMLQLCGWLNMDAEKPTLTVLPVSPQSPVADALEEMARNQKDAMRTLAVIADAVGLQPSAIGLPEHPPKSQQAGPKKKSR